MRKSTTLLFLIVLIIGPNIIASAVSATTVAETKFWGDNVIDGSNLQISLSSTGPIKQEVGARNLVSFEQRGYSNEGNYTKVKAHAVFEFSADFYSNYAASDVFSGESEYEQRIPYCTVYACTQPSQSGTYQIPVTYYVTCKDWALGSFTGQGYQGDVSVKATVKDLTPDVLNFGGSRYTLTTKQFVAQVNKIGIKSRDYYEIEPAQNHYVNPSPVAVSTTSLTKSPINEPANNKDLLSDLGVNVIQTFNVNDPSYQGVVQLPATGNDMVMEHGFPLTIKPNIVLQKQQLEQNYRSKVTIDTSCDWWDYGHCGVLLESQYSSAKGINSDIYRTISWTVENYCAKITFTVEADIYALVEITPKYSNNKLGDPVLMFEDLWWDTSIGGTGADYTITEDLWTQFWANNTWWIALIGIAIVAVLLLIYTPLGPMLIKSHFRRNGNR
jgi:hypothetical protein